MSKTDTCLKCGRVGHTSSSCPRYTGQIAPHTAEPFDGHERDMHKCSDCTKGSLRGCAQFVPSISQPIRCSEFKAKVVRR